MNKMSLLGFLPLCVHDTDQNIRFMYFVIRNNIISKVHKRISYDFGINIFV